MECLTNADDEGSWLWKIISRCLWVIGLPCIEPTSSSVTHFNSLSRSSLQWPWPYWPRPSEASFFKLHDATANEGSLVRCSSSTAFILWLDRTLVFCSYLLWSSRWPLTFWPKSQVSFLCPQVHQNYKFDGIVLSGLWNIIVTYFLGMHTQMDKHNASHI